MVLLISVAQLHGMKVEGDETNTIAQSYKMLGIWITQHKASTALKSECRGGGSLLSRVVHILTLIIHVLNDDDERLPSMRMIPNEGFHDHLFILILSSARQNLSLQDFICFILDGRAARASSGDQCIG
jgi:hypothetical protein